MEELNKVSNHIQVFSSAQQQCSIHILGTSSILALVLSVHQWILFGAEKRAVKSMDIRSGGKLGTTEFFFCLDISPIYTMYSKGFFFEAGLFEQ